MKGSPRMVILLLKQILSMMIMVALYLRIM